MAGESVNAIAEFVLSIEIHEWLIIFAMLATPAAMTLSFPLGTKGFQYYKTIICSPLHVALSLMVGAGNEGDNFNANGFCFAFLSQIALLLLLENTLAPTQEEAREQEERQARPPEPKRKQPPRAAKNVD